MSTSTLPHSATADKSPLPALHITFLDGIRGLAALYVVLYHFLGLYREGLSHGEIRIASLAEGGTARSRSLLSCPVLVSCCPSRARRTAG